MMAILVIFYLNGSMTTQNMEARACDDMARLINSSQATAVPMAKCVMMKEFK